MRNSLKIPQDSIVFGYYWGSNCFDIPFVKSSISKVIDQHSNIYFLFMNINPFIVDKKVIFLKGTSSIEEKARFVSTCDAMLHARFEGETFGLACGEFSVMNKPVIAYEFPSYKSHLQILGEKAILYSDEISLIQILLNLRNYMKFNNYDCYSHAFNPRSVMNKFQNVFIKM